MTKTKQNPSQKPAVFFNVPREMVECPENNLINTEDSQSLGFLSEAVKESFGVSISCFSLSLCLRKLYVFSDNN